MAETTPSRLSDLLATEPRWDSEATSVSLLNDVFSAARQPMPPGKIKIQLTNSAQGAHLLQTLRGHCDVDLLPGSEGTAVVVSGRAAGNKAILRRLDAWLREFGVESISIELNGRTYEMKKP